MTLSISIAVLLFLFLCAGFFASAETALFSLTKIERRRLAERHPKIVHWVTNHLDHPSKTLVTLLIGNLATHTLATAVVTLIVMDLWGHAALGLAMVIFTIVLVVFCEILPKTIAVVKNEMISLFVALPLFLFGLLVYPFQVIMRFTANKILLLLVGEKKVRSEKISEEELKTLASIGEEEGVLDRQERYMIHKLFELGERQVREIMTPRVDLAGLDIEDKTAEHVELIQKYHFSHFPVYKETLDHILGVISVQGFMLSKQKELMTHLKQPLFVPESKRIDNLLEEFRKKKVNFAICVDEFGGTAGIVTLEDILEEIFGEFHDEYAKVENPVRPYGKKEFLVEAKIGLVDFNEYFSTNLEAGEATTLGGFILEKLGEVPKRGTTVNIPEMDIGIHHVVRHRIITVTVRPKQ